jgi:brefeldin A-resistance guanine nucleotide exchange factor 1
MHALVRTIFTRLYFLDPSTEEAKLQITDEDTPEGEIKLTVVASAGPADLTASEESGDRQEMAVDDLAILEKEINPDEAASLEGSVPAGPKPECRLSESCLSVRTPTNCSSDGLPAIIELLRVLINILDPNDQVHTDSTRLTALGILNAAFEVSGSRIGDYPSLKALVVDPGCKFLFQLARSENTGVLHLALRTISTLFETMRKHLKLQQELFLAFTIDRLAPPAIATPHLNKKGTFSPRPATPANSTPTLGSEASRETGRESPAPQRHPKVSPARGETRDLILETLRQISRHPSFMVDVYTNYDCDINCENLFERLIDFLTKVSRFLYGQSIALILFRVSIRHIIPVV